MLAMDSWNRVGKYPSFRFKEKWLLDESFMKLIQQTSIKFIRGSYEYQVARKTEILKKRTQILKNCYNNSLIM